MYYLYLNNTKLILIENKFNKFSKFEFNHYPLFRPSAHIHYVRVYVCVYIT